MTPEENENVFFWIGDFTFYLKIRTHCNIGLISFFFSTLVNQLLHYNQHKNNKIPTYLKPFAMMSGLVPPRAIGLTNPEKIMKMMRNSRMYFTLCEYCIKITIRLFALVAILLPFVLYKTIPSIVFLGLPYGILFGLGCYHSFSIYLWQLVYFHTICYYIKIKLRQVRIEVCRKIYKKKAINDFTVMETIQTLNSVYKEITSYNKNYWYKYLFWIWLLSASMINMGLYLVFFGIISYFAKSIILYGTLLIGLMLIFIINIASEVSLEANKFCMLLNTLMTLDRKRNITATVKIKV